jgi:glutamine amidotransferase
LSADVVIVDSGGANLASLQHALARLGSSSVVSQQAADIMSARRVLLPGVGSAATAMTTLQKTGLDRLLPTLTQPVLGICLGMQLMFENSAEGDTAGLCIVPGRVARLEVSVDRPVPHMGWNTLVACQPDALLAQIDTQDRMYFVHSFAAPVGPWTTASCEYGSDFSAVIARGNFRGVQFHPERSGVVGARLLANFLAL